MENFEKLKSERNIEKDQQAFIEAIAVTSIKEIPAIFSEMDTEDLMSSLKSTKALLLGEVHGVKENVDVIYTLFKRFGFRNLALEWRPELKGVTEKFLESGELDFNAIQESPDGRISAGHFALLQKLKTEGILEGVVCYDGGAEVQGWNARDEAMAKNILDSLSDTPTLIVAGNFHARTESFSFDEEAGEKHPMGENIKNVIPSIAAGRIAYRSGYYHNFGTKEFTPLSEGESSSGPKFYRDENEVYIFELVEAHAAIVPNPSERI